MYPVNGSVVKNHPKKNHKKTLQSLLGQFNDNDHGVIRVGANLTPAQKCKLLIIKWITPSSYRFFTRIF